jgi:hypothetical protein
MFIVPVPGFGVDRLTDRAKDTQTAEIVVFHMLGTKSVKEVNGSRSRIELGKLVLLDGLPVARWCGVNWSSFKDGSADSICEWSINNVSMSSNPTDISHASELVIRVDIKDVFYSKGGAKEVSSSGMDNTLGVSCRSRNPNID